MGLDWLAGKIEFTNLYGIQRGSCCFQLPRQLPHYVWRLSEVAASFKFVQTIVASQISIHLGETISNNNSVQLNTLQSFSLHQGRPDLNSSLWVTSGFVFQGSHWNIGLLKYSWYLLVIGDSSFIVGRFFLLAQTKVLLTFPEIYCWCFRNPVNSPVEVGSLSDPVIYRVLDYIPGGSPDFWTMNTSTCGISGCFPKVGTTGKRSVPRHQCPDVGFKIQSLKQALETDGSPCSVCELCGKNMYIYI